MNENLIKFVERMIEPKTRKIINSNELFEIFESMGALHDDELINDVINYFDSKKIDIDFRGDENKQFQPIYQRARMNAKVMKQLKINKKHVSELMKRADKVNSKTSSKTLEDLKVKYFPNNNTQ